MKIRLITPILLYVVAFSAHASIVNTLNNTEYEWLELTQTKGLSRDQVEAQLNDVNSQFYGYEYASRELVAELFSTYAAFAGVEGYTRDSTLVSGAEQFLSDFGITKTVTSSTRVLTDVNGSQFAYNYYEQAYGMYGLDGECGVDTCVSNTLVMYYRGQSVATRPLDRHGYDANYAYPYTNEYTSMSPYFGSFLVRETMAPIPLPPAIWLFVTALLGLISVARIKK